MAKFSCILTFGLTLTNNDSPPMDITTLVNRMRFIPRTSTTRAILTGEDATKSAVQMLRVVVFVPSSALNSKRGRISVSATSTAS